MGGFQDAWILECIIQNFVCVSGAVSISLIIFSSESLNLAVECQSWTDGCLHLTLFGGFCSFVRICQWHVQEFTLTRLGKGPLLLIRLLLSSHVILATYSLWIQIPSPCQMPASVPALTTDSHLKPLPLCVPQTIQKTFKIFHLE